MPPWLVFVLLLSLTIALGYQLLTRRFGWRVVAYWIVVFLAVMCGEALAEAAGVSVTRFGDLRLAPDVVGGLLAASGLWFLGV